MKRSSVLRWGSLLLGGSLVCAAGAVAQRIQGAKVTARTPAYDLSREITLVGTVVKYTASSETPPIGAHVLLQTSSGQVDIHLGDARVLKLNKFSITEGSTLRVIGLPVDSGDRSIFLARIIQQGTQALAVRSEKGIPLTTGSLRANPSAKAQAQPQRGGAQ